MTGIDHSDEKGTPEVPVEEAQKLEAARRSLYEEREPRNAMANFYNNDLMGGFNRKMAAGMDEVVAPQYQGKTYGQFFSDVDAACIECGIDIETVIAPTVAALRENGGRLDPDPVVSRQLEQAFAESIFPVFEKLVTDYGYSVDSLKM